jgi:TAG lipase / steryl ester hydrolase / phospholipase A2 / LPA acyltransferase
VAATETHQKSRLLNAIASPNVYIREAVLASGAVPGVYPPVTLAAKNHLGEKQAYLPSRKWVDGSVSDDMPAKRLARLYGVNHYIVSQTNPHVLPFVADGKRKQDPLSVWKDASTKTARAWVNASAVTLEKPLSMSPSLSRMTNLWLSVINQDYIGDINILPSTRFFNPFRLLAFLTEKEIRELVVAGEKATWPKIEMIRIQTRISRTLDRILVNSANDHVMHVKGALRKRPR